MKNIPPIKFVPYREILGVNFGASAADVIGKHGAPEREGQNRNGCKELFYKDKIFRFRQCNSELREVTVNMVLNMEQIALDGEPVTFRDLPLFLLNHDKGSFEVRGFTVSPKYGLAFDPLDRHFLTAFCESDLAEWEK